MGNGPAGRGPEETLTMNDGPMCTEHEQLDGQADPDCPACQQAAREARTDGEDRDWWY